MCSRYSTGHIIQFMLELMVNSDIIHNSYPELFGAIAQEDQSVTKFVCH